jgi:hypothetical protein
VEMPDINARCDRLNALIVGLMREQAIVAKGDDPLLYLERRAYLGALSAAVSGLESARVVLAKAKLRLEQPQG